MWYSIEYGYDFGYVEVNSSSTKTLTLSNKSKTSIKNLTVSSVSSSAFLQSNNCPDTLNSDEECKVSISFYPKAKQEYFGSFSITSNDYYNPTVHISLSGIGADLDKLSAKDGIIYFGEDIYEKKVTNGKMEDFTLLTSEVENNKNLYNISFDLDDSLLDTGDEIDHIKYGYKIIKKSSGTVLALAIDNGTISKTSNGLKHSFIDKDSHIGVYYYTEDEGVTRVEKPYKEDKYGKIIHFVDNRLYFDLNQLSETIKDDYSLSSSSGEYEITFIMEYDGDNETKGFGENSYFTTIAHFNIYNDKTIKIGVDNQISFSKPIGFSGKLILQ